MMDRYDIRLNNRRLADLGESVFVTDVSEGAPSEDVSGEEFGGRDGTRLVSVTRRSLQVTATLVIRERDIQRKADVYERVRLWARGGGYLMLGGRHGQRLYVERVQLPSLGSAKKWTDGLKVVFAAYAKPFWESAYEVVATIGTAATSGSATLLPPGGGEKCVVDAEVTAVGGAVSTLTVTAGDTSMAFASLGLAQGQTLRVGHTEDGLLYIRIGNTSAMGKRTGASSDELELMPGVPGAVSFSANRTCRAVFKTRGRW